MKAKTIAGQEDAMRLKDVKVWAADLSVAVDPVAKLSVAASPADVAAASETWDAASGEVRVAGAANEAVAFQLFVEKSAGRVESIRFEGAGDVETGLLQHVAVPVAVKGADGAAAVRLLDDALVPVSAGDCGGEVAAVAKKAPRVSGRRRQGFTVELFVPKGAPAGERQIGVCVRAGGAEHRVRVRLKVYGFELPDENGCVADINNYSLSIARGFPGMEEDRARYLAAERLYFRMAREHRALFHLLPYGQSGRIEAGFGPTLAGRGRTRHVADWAPFDTHWGGYLDGSAFAGCRSGDRPVEYLYSPVNCNWPAYFEKYGTPGYWHEYATVLREMAAHFAERGWTRTRLEVFFNHKARWKFFPWDMDEIRFERDNGATIEYAKRALDAVREFPQVQIVNRIDSSWIFDRSAQTEMGDLIGLWVVNRGAHSDAPDSVRMLRGKGQCVWFYGGSGPISAADRLDNLRWAWIAWGRETDGFCWWNGTAHGSWDDAADGTGHCFYPGAPFGIDGPLASIRLKMLRRGMQDHAYLSLLTARTGSRSAADAIVGRTVGASCREDWYQRGEQVESGGADIVSGSQTRRRWNTAPLAAWTAARTELADAIERA